VIVCCPLPLDLCASSQEALLWNYDEAMNVIHQYNCVKACLSGHDHKGGHSTDAFGHIDVYDNRLLLCVTDRMQGTEMSFNP
jgi:manganese-dependent ADP-ribose/CDP-alcohol diphosphatase